MSEFALRDDHWLKTRLEYLWTTYYNEGPEGYPIQINFGRSARYRFGSIFNQGKSCRILINGLFAHPEVPETVVDATIAHELAHYVHGYASGLPKLHAHPHRGGVIDREMRNRGCYFLEETAGSWRKANWQQFYETRAKAAVDRRSVSEQRASDLWKAFLGTDGFRSEEQLARRADELAIRFGFERSPFTVYWLPASIRRTGLSYRFRNDGAVRVHAVLAHPSAPKEVLDYELCYWLAVERVGSRWENVERALHEAGVWTSSTKAIHWRRNSWRRFRLKHLPLN